MHGADQSVNLAGTLAGALTWTSGTVYGQLTVGAGATLTLSGTETKYLGAALTNAGTINLLSPLEFYWRRANAGQPGRWLD